MSLREYLTVAKEFVKHLNSLNISHALIGGVGTSLWSEERFTKDVDFTVAMDSKQWPLLEAALAKDPDAKIFKTNTDSGETVPYLIRLTYKAITIDLLTAQAPFQALLLTRKLLKKVDDTDFYLATAEDIIILKLLANRAQDRTDIGKILLHVKKLDFPYIEQWATTWEVLDLWHQIQKENNI